MSSITRILSGRQDSHKAFHPERPHNVRTEFIALVGEFCGTFMFLLLSYFGAQTAITNNVFESGGDGPLFTASLLYIAVSFGSALAINVWIFYRVSGGMFNPAVTLGLVLVGAVKPIRAALIIPTQLIAGIAAAWVVDAILPGPLSVANTLSNGTSITQGLFLEMFLTAQLILTVYFLAVEKHRSTFLAPIGVGISVFIAHIAGTNYTGTGINPARSLGPATVAGFVGYHWIYWLGPVLGAFVSFGCYKLLKVMDYESANPGQDAEDEEKASHAALYRSRNSFSPDHQRVAAQNSSSRQSFAPDHHRVAAQAPPLASPDTAPSPTSIHFGDLRNNTARA